MNLNLKESELIATRRAPRAVRDSGPPAFGPACTGLRGPHLRDRRLAPRRRGAGPVGTSSHPILIRPGYTQYDLIPRVPPPAGLVPFGPCPRQ